MPAQKKPRNAIVIGTGITGLAAARVLADRGVRVTLLERDDEPPARSAEGAFAKWKRRGAPQVRHSHAFLGRLRAILRDHYPDLLAALLKAGARELDMIAFPPLSLGALERQPGDEDLIALGCRRTTFEWVIRREVLRGRHVKLIPGATVRGLFADPSDPPVVTGVRCSIEGEDTRLDADFVVDASGRTSKAMDWLRAIGARAPHEEQESSGIVYYTRFYRWRRGVADPPRSKDPVMADYNWVKFAIFPADDGVYSITLAVPLAFPRLKVLARPAAFDAMVRSFPGLVPFVDAGRPIDLDHPVQAMGGLINRLRRFADERGPLAERFFVLGDAAYCTNPLYGRGCTQGFLHAQLLGRALDESASDYAAAAVRLDELARAEIEPFYRASVLADRDAVRKAEGRPPGSVLAQVQHRFFEDGVLPATRCDPAVYRAFARMFNMLETPEQAFFRPEIVARVLAVMARGRWWNRRYALPDPPDREQLFSRCEAAAAKPV